MADPPHAGHLSPLSVLSIFISMLMSPTLTQGSGAVLPCCVSTEGHSDKQSLPFYWNENMSSLNEKFLSIVICATMLLACTSDGKQERTQPEIFTTSITEAYRLAPDRRALSAVAEIHHFLTGDPVDSVHASFMDSVWRISYRDAEVGTLPEIPDFRALMALETQWATEVGTHNPITWTAEPHNDLREIATELERFGYSNVTRSLRSIDSLWATGLRDPEMLHLAARGFSLLSVQVLDELGMADRIATKGMAFLALTRALTSIPCNHEEALLAYEMGYSGHAGVIVDSLPPSDPVRSYVLHDDATLQRLADASDATLETRYYNLLRLAQGHSIEGYRLSRRKHFSGMWHWLPVYRAEIKFGEFGAAGFIAEVLPRLILLDLAQESGVLPDFGTLASHLPQEPFSEADLVMIMRAIDLVLRSQTATLVNNFESGLDHVGGRYTGPFLDAATWRVFYKSYFFSAYHALGIHYLDMLSSTQAAVSFSTALGKAGAGIAADLQHWYRNLSMSKSGQLDPAVLIDNLGSLRIFGAPPLLRVYDEQKDYFGFGAPERLQAVRRLAARLDTRLSHVSSFAHMAYEDLLDLPLAQHLYQHIIRNAPLYDPHVRAWYAYLTGDSAGVWAVFHQPTVDLDTRKYILRLLDDDKPHLVIGAYRSLVEEFPNVYMLRYEYSQYLAKIERYAEARHEMIDWLRRRVSTAGLENIAAKSQIARMYMKEKRPREAWNIIGPEIDSWKGEAMTVGAEALLALGREREAENLCADLIHRYPDSKGGRIAVAGMYWTMRKNADAAAILLSSPQPFSVAEWQFDIAPKFASGFENRPLAELEEAFRVLMESGVERMSLDRLSTPFANTGRHEIAFAMRSKVRASGIENLVYLVNSYHELKEWKGRTAALQWLSGKLPNFINPLSMIAYERRDSHELLWDCIRNPVVGEGVDFVWLMRAAAFVQSAEKDPAHRDELLRYYQGHGDGDYDKVGQFLMGLATEKDVLQRAALPKRVCELSYYCGLKAQVEGRYEDASRWYRNCIETGLKNNGEYRWAYTALYRWYSSGKSLERLQKDRE